MFEKGDSSKRRKNGCSFQQLLRQNLGWFSSEQRKTLCLRGLILKPTKPTERKLVPLKTVKRFSKQFSV